MTRVRTLWLISILLLLTQSKAFATRIPEAELETRKQLVAQDYKILNSIFPLAHKSPHFNAWLERLHFSKKLYEQIETEIGVRAAHPLDLDKLDYATHDSALSDCHKSTEVGVRVETVAFTLGKVVHLCRKYFTIQNYYERAKVLLHEQIHVAGIPNECDTEAVAFITFYAANKPTDIAYLHRCAVFKEFIRELMENWKKK